VKIRSERLHAKADQRSGNGVLNMRRNSRARSAAISRARGVTYGLLAFLCLAVATAAATDYAGADSKDTKLARADEPMVVALAVSTPSIPGPPPAMAPLMSAPLAPAPARFFTINEVMAKRSGRAPSGIQLASVDPAHTATDTNSAIAPGPNRSKEPFGLFTFVAPDGQLWTKWRKVDADLRAVEPILTRCLADANQCPPGAARFGAIVNEAREQKGRARFELVNQRVNNAVRYKSDMEQWGVPDRWSTPLDTADTGSFNTGFGDCEDFAIAKYTALRAAGVPAGQLRVMLVHDKMARMDHAVLAALDDGHWFILDNRWMTLVEDTEARQFSPLFALDEQGVKLLAAPYAANSAPNRETAEVGGQIFSPGGAALELSPAGDVTGIRAAPVLL